MRLQLPRGFEGIECVPDVFDALLQSQLAVIWFVILALLLRNCITSFRAKITVRNNRLHMMSIIQYVGQLTWMLGTRLGSPIVPPGPIVLYVGIAIAFLGGFLFMSEMTISCTLFILQATSDDTVRQLLNHVIILFRILPVIVSASTILAFIFADSTQTAFVVVFIINELCFFGVAVALSYSIYLMDCRVRRLLPKIPNESMKSKKSSVLRKAAQTEIECLMNSQMLRDMGRSITCVCLSTVFFSTAYMLVFTFADWRFGVAPTVLYGIFQLAQALVPYVAMSTLVSMGDDTRQKTRRRISKKNRIAPVIVSSYDCGTL